MSNLETVVAEHTVTLGFIVGIIAEFKAYKDKCLAVKVKYHK